MPVNFEYGTPPGEDDILKGSDALAEQHIQRQRIAADIYRAQLRNQVGNAEVGVQAQQQAFDQSQARPQMFQAGSYQSPTQDDGSGVFSAGPHPAEVGKVLDGQIDQIVQTVGQQRLNPQGQAQYSDWAGKLRAVQKMRSKLRPEQYNQVAAKLINDFRQRRINNYVVRQPTVQEDWMNSAIPSHDGGFLVRDYDKNGRPRFKRIEAGPHDATLGPMSPQQRFEASMAKTPDGGFAVYDPDKGWQVHAAKASKEHERPSLSEYLADRRNYAKEYQDARDRMPLVPSLDANGNEEKGSDGKTVMREPTAEEIQREMDRYLNAQEAHVFSRGVMDNIHRNAGNMPPAPGSQPPGAQLQGFNPQQPVGGAQGVPPVAQAGTPVTPGQAAAAGGVQGAASPPQSQAPPQLSTAAIQETARHALNGPHEGLPDWKESDGASGIWGHGQPINPNLKRLAFTRQLHKQLGGDPNSQYALSVLTGAWHVYPHASELYKTLGRSSDAHDYEAARHLVLSRLKGVETPEAQAIRKQMKDFSIGAMQQELAKLGRGAGGPKQSADNLSANAIENPKRGQAGQASDQEIAAVFDRGRLLSEHLPGMKDDLEFLRDTIEKHGSNPSEWPEEDKRRADQAMSAIAVNEQSSQKPWPKPAKKADMVTGAVYKLIRKSDGRTYRALWNGKMFIALGVYQ